VISSQPKLCAREVLYRNLSDAVEMVGSPETIVVFAAPRPRPRTQHGHRRAWIAAVPTLAARVARGAGLPRPLARVTHQHSKHLHDLEPGVVSGPDVDKDTIHHKELARLHRFFDNLESLMEERVHALAMELEKFRQELARTRRVLFPARPGS
jgi:hypothetical protein